MNPKQQFITHAYNNRHAKLFEYSETLRHCDIKKIEIIPEKVICELNSGIKMLIPPFDERSIPLDILNFGSHELHELHVQKRIIQEHSSKVILDIGANHGWYSLEIAKEFPQTEILAFEAVPSTLNILIQNLELNNNPTNIQTFELALSDQEEITPFFFNPKLSVNASFQNLQNSIDATSVMIQTQTLDNFCKTYNVLPDFIKCDVEGAEFKVFQGGKNIIKEKQPIIFTEMLRKWSAAFNYHPNDIILFLEDLGYRCFKISNQDLQEITNINDETIETNFIFMPNQIKTSST